nr:MAG TPA: hypothetical protein [Caudoviricetes sp.]
MINKEFDFYRAQNFCFSLRTSMFSAIFRVFVQLYLLSSFLVLE